MSTLVSLLLAAVMSFLGAEVPEEQMDVSQVEIEICEESPEILASNRIIIKNEQLFKVKGIR